MKGLGYDSKTGAITVGVNRDDAFELAGHELKHAFQYETGKVSIRTDGSGAGRLNDIGDETEAANRDILLSTGSTFFSNPKTKFSDADTRQWGLTKMTPPAYQDLPPGPIDINSKEGKALRQETINAGRTGQLPKEVYKGWQKDYEKGQKQ